MKKRIITDDPQFEGLDIMTNPEEGHTCDTKILRELKNQFDYAEKTKTKAYVMRFDVHLPEGKQAPNEVFSKFENAFNKRLSRKGLRPQYVAVREQSKEDHQHYHDVHILDGSKTEHAEQHLKLAEHLWEKTLGLPKNAGRGLVHFCQKEPDEEKPLPNGVMLNRNAKNYGELRNACFKRASYLAKTYTKINQPGQRELFSSRLPKE